MQTWKSGWPLLVLGTSGLACSSEPLAGESPAGTVREAVASGPWTEAQKILPSIVGLESGFGNAVAISGDTAIIGAYGEPAGTVEGVGAAYVFVRSEGAWVEQQRLGNPDGQEFDGFGRSVALDGDIAIIGSAENDDPSFNEGTAYVFERTGTSFALTQILRASDPVENGLFGASVALAGDTAVIGAFGANAAYVFQRAAGGFVQQQKLVPVPAVNGGFGENLTLAGDTLFVGAATTPGGGSVFAFERQGGAFSQVQAFTGSDVETGDLFGFGLAISGDTAYVGAPNKTIGENAIQGAAYVFTRTAGVWSEQARLTGSVPGNIDQFGVAIGVTGDTAFIGAPGTTVGGIVAVGMVYQFAPSGPGWAEQAQLVPSDAASATGSGIAFGTALAVDATNAIIGGPNAGFPPPRLHGSAYVFTPPSGGGQGDPCGSASECASGSCIDGVCCETSSCAGCFACAAALTGAPDGNCAPVIAGTDPSDACAVTGPAGDPCASSGLCDGAGACDAVASEGTECETLCVRPHGPPKTIHGECDGAGTCEQTHGPGTGNGNACL